MSRLVEEVQQEILGLLQQGLQRSATFCAHYCAERVRQSRREMFQRLCEQKGDVGNATDTMTPNPCKTKGLEVSAPAGESRVVETSPCSRQVPLQAEKDSSREDNASKATRRHVSSIHEAMAMIEEAISYTPVAVESSHGPTHNAAKSKLSLAGAVASPLASADLGGMAESPSRSKRDEKSGDCVISAAEVAPASESVVEVESPSRTHPDDESGHSGHGHSGHGHRHSGHGHSGHSGHGHGHSGHSVVSESKAATALQKYVKAKTVKRASTTDAVHRTVEKPASASSTGNEAVAFRSMVALRMKIKKVRECFFCVHGCGRFTGGPKPCCAECKSKDGPHSLACQKENLRRQNAAKKLQRKFRKKLQTDVFISYFAKQSDATFDLLLHSLSLSGLKVFNQKRDLAGAQVNIEAMELHVQHSRLMLILLSPGYFKSLYCCAEVMAADKAGIPVLTVYSSRQFSQEKIEQCFAPAHDGKMQPAVDALRNQESHNKLIDIWNSNSMEELPAHMNEHILSRFPKLARWTQPRFDEPLQISHHVVILRDPQEDEVQDTCGLLLFSFSVCGLRVRVPNDSDAEDGSIDEIVRGTRLILALLSTGFFESEVCRAAIFAGAKEKVPILPVYSGQYHTLSEMHRAMTHAHKKHTAVAKPTFKENLIDVHNPTAQAVVSEDIKEKIIRRFFGMELKRTPRSTLRHSGTC